MPLSPRTLRPSSSFTPKSISGLALWLDASATGDLYTTDAGPVTAVSSPTEISGCVGWWDASDASSITASGGLVSQWNDKSGQGNHATASTTARPTTGTRTVGGKNALDFDGVANTLAANGIGSVMSGLDKQATVFVVVDADTLGVNTALGAWNSSSSNFPFYLLRTDGTNWQATKRDDSAATKTVTTTAASTSAAVVSFVTNGTTTSASQNGLSVLSSGDTDVGQTTLDRFSIGSTNPSTGAGGFFDGLFAEIVVYNTALSTADRARVESYLAAKWGISGVHAAATSASDPVGYWRDRSGNGRHATQATGGSRPRIASAATNGRNVAEWHSSTSRMQIASTAVLNDSMTLFAVAKRGPTQWGGGGGGGYGSILNEAGTGSGPQLRAENGVLDLFGGSNKSSFTPSGSLGVSSPIIISGAISSLATSLFINGAVVDSDAAAGSAASGSLTEIGAYNASTGGGGPLNAEIAELITYSRAISAPERQRIERYLAAKWGIVLAPQVINADAQDWINRVYANGGTVTSSTASAVNTLCDSLTSAGLRDRFYRLNLFCGTGLNACLVPLYRGPSLSGTQYGNTTDTNVGPFVSGDYSESGGLTASQGSTKYLDTGLSTSALPASAYESAHLSAWHSALPAINTDPYMLGAHNSSTDRFSIQSSIRTAAAVGESTRLGKNTAATGGTLIQGARPATSLIGSRTSATSLILYRNGVADATQTTSTTGIAGNAFPFYVFRTNNTGSVLGDMPGFSMFSYSIGDDLTASQAASLHSALAAFHASMRRSV